jgi:hypothetical protein
VTTAGSPQTGTINNDEVDWGDGPDSLPTLSFNNGARHNTILGFQLGASIDGDPDGQSPEEHMTTWPTATTPMQKAMTRTA